MSTTGSWDETLDRVVVGAGADVHAAAMSARDAALSVLLLEKGYVPGGTTAKSGGSI